MSETPEKYNTKMQTQRSTRIRAEITKTSTGKLGFECTVEMESTEDPSSLSDDVMFVLENLRDKLETEIEREP